MRYWLLLCLFLPPFHLSLMIKYWLLSCLFLQRSCFESDAFARTTINFFFHWREEGSVWGESAPSETEKIMQVLDSICIRTHCNFDNFFVRHGVSPTTQIAYTYEYSRVRQSNNEFTCDCQKKKKKKKKKRCFSPKRKTIIVGLMLCLIKTCRTSYKILLFLSIFFYDKILAIVIFSSYLFCSDSFARTIINIWREKGGVWGRSTLQFSNLTYSTGAYQAFVNILLKIHYSFPIKYWL